MHYTKILPISLIAGSILTYNPFVASANTSCVSDYSLSSFARQRVTTTATDLQKNLRMPEFSDQADSIKKAIDKTSLKTGGKIRDIYVGGASVQDKQGMVEEYLRKQLKNPDDAARALAEEKAEALLGVADRDLNQFFPLKDGYQGSGSSSRSLSGTTTTNTRSGSFKLQQRGFLGLSEDVGRFNYTVTAKATVAVQNISFSQKYNHCANANQYEDGFYSAKVVVTPYLDVSYQFSHLGGSRSNRYHTFSGRFIITDNQDRVEREINGYQ